MQNKLYFIVDTEKFNFKMTSKAKLKKQQHFKNLVCVETIKERAYC